MHFLRQSTATTIKIGPFVDDTDGKTAETALTISQADVRLSKNGGNYAQKNESSSGSHDELGEYDVDLDATDTNTVGRLRVSVQESGALPVWRDFQVLEEAVYDALFATSATGKLPATLATSDVTGNLPANVNAMAANVLTASAIADGALTAAKFAAGAFDAVWAVATRTLSAFAFPVTISGTKTTLDALNDIPAGSAMALTSGERTTLAASIEAAIINELDGNAVMQAIADLIADDMTTGDLSVQAIASACRDAILDRVLAGNHDTANTTGKILQDIPTSISGLENLSQAEAQAACDAAIASYDPPTKAELDTAESNIRGADSDTLKTLSDQIDGISASASPQLLQNTTIATLATQTSFTLTAGSADDNAYNGAVAIVTDQTTSTQKAFVPISDYTGSTKTVALASAPPFTIAVGDTIDIIAAASDAPTAAAIRQEMDSNSTKLSSILDDTENAIPALFPINFASLLINVSGHITRCTTVDTVTDKAGYTISGTKTTLDALNDIPAGSAMALTSGERTTLAAAIEAAIINELDGNAVMQAIADLIADDMTTGDLSVQAIASACRDAILDRVLAGNHDAANTTGKLIQDIDNALSAIDSNVDSVLVDTGIIRLQLVAGVPVTSFAVAALAQMANTDTGEVSAADGSVAKISQGAAGGNVTVGAMTAEALAQFLTDDTGETSAADGSVGKLSQGSADAAQIVALLLSSVDGVLNVRRRSGLVNAATNDLELIEKNDYTIENGHHDTFDTDLAGEAADYSTVECNAVGIDNESVTFAGTATLRDTADGIVCDVEWPADNLIYLGKHKWSVRVTHTDSWVDTPVRGTMTVVKDTFNP